MSNAPKPKPPTAPAPAVFGSDAAPMIFFDGVVALGHNNGIVQLELAANTVVPITLDKPECRTRTVVTAHLRCSVTAAKALRDLLDTMLTPTADQTRQ